MPLLSLVASNPEAVHQLTIEQVVATAGDGRLRDGTDSQRELRDYLGQVSIDALATYADYCLTNAFSKSGQVLQDIVNELGRRLEYSVTNGRYQGTSNAIGHDGIWRDPSGHGLVIEVKTTDAYRLSLDTVAKYRDQLLDQNLLTRPCSILIVVGRTDTGELEAQVRGSRHAWDIRLISMDALLNLVRIKESADSPDTIAKIRRLLTPLEYTRVDDLVDVVFRTTQDVETAVSAETSTSNDESENYNRGDSSQRNWDFTPTEVIQQIREKIVAALGRQLGCSFVKRSRALYWDPTQRRRVVCTVSKRYAAREKYWYAYHPKWHTFLQQGESGFFVLGCTDSNFAFALPVSVVTSHLEDFNTTEKEDGSLYYHIKIVETATDRFALYLPRTGQTLSLDAYTVRLNAE